MDVEARCTGEMRFRSGSVHHEGKAVSGERGGCSRSVLGIEIRTMQPCCYLHRKPVEAHRNVHVSFWCWAIRGALLLVHSGFGDQGILREIGKTCIYNADRNHPTPVRMRRIIHLKSPMRSSDLQHGTATRLFNGLGSGSKSQQMDAIRVAHNA